MFSYQKCAVVYFYRWKKNSFIADYEIYFYSVWYTNSYFMIRCFFSCKRVLFFIVNHKYVYITPRLLIWRFLSSRWTTWMWYEYENFNYLIKNEVTELDFSLLKRRRRYCIMLCTGSNKNREARCSVASFSSAL